MRERNDAFRLLAVLLAVAVAGPAVGNDAEGGEPKPVAIGSRPVVLEAESAALAPGRVATVAKDSFSGKMGVSLKPEAAGRVDSPDAAPDLEFRVTAAKPGRYLIRTHAAVDKQGRQLMRRAKGKQDSLFMKIAVGDARPTRRVVFVPWSRPESCRQTTGKFALDGTAQAIRLWLPKGVVLDSLEVRPYHPPKVPEAAAAYRPRIVPPPSHPRLWVNRDSLPGVRANLEKGENAPLWEKIRKQADRPFPFKAEPGKEIGHNSALESAAVAKAFVYLMTGNRMRGREAVELMIAYLDAVEFGNVLDITREIGRAIYSGALVYDWCHDLMSPAERDSMRRNFMRLADDMEIGWPPFLQSIVNGHGNEAQINRDLLSMSIAIHDEDPLPYRYCSYRILEELVPMRRFEYQSPRHNQGVSYGPYRFGWDMHAAWILRRMVGRPVFGDNIAGVYQSWIHMRLPNGETFRDGDGFSDGRPANFGLTPMLVYSYAGDPVVKYDALEQGKLIRFPIPGLLLNDPDLKPAESFDSLPRTIDFGAVLGGMVARTGWRMGAGSPEAVVAMFGGGYQFGNHHHADAGSFQIYYHGLQAADLGQYRFYGTPYDYNFCKRSVAHSMMLVVDPNEKFPPGTANDGGTRFVRANPKTPEEAKTNHLFANGRVVSADFGPSRKTPQFSYFSVDLASAYSAKVAAYVRSFCFLNLGKPKTPAVLVILDSIRTANPEFRKIWQINTLKPPEATPDGAVLRNSEAGKTGKVHVRMLLPKPADRTMTILSGRDANSVGGRYFEPPKPARPEANGHRILFSPKPHRTDDTFLTVLSMCDGETPPPPVGLKTLPDVFVLSIADRTIVLSRDGKLIETPVQFEVTGKAPREVLVAGLAPGRWSVLGQGKKVRQTADVESRRNTAFLVLPRGRYTMRPE